ncbi:hypothetical protein [Piscicoccus intestinalis]|uniref:hypothetical protein n=1 Tax=Piscicoccus intestinalis TaxID=746033 RepID=UPI0012EE4D1A|nr:hypothetical protein [Piscicoccus intestinalis]
MTEGFDDLFVDFVDSAEFLDEDDESAADAQASSEESDEKPESTDPERDSLNTPIYSALFSWHAQPHAAQPSPAEGPRETVGPGPDAADDNWDDNTEGTDVETPSGPGGIVSGDDPADWAGDVDTSLVPPEEMRGVWLVTETGRESPLRLDGQPIEPEDLALPADIAYRLLDWSDQWQAEWDDARGWLPRARIGDFEALGRWLARRVKDSVGAIEVTLEPPHLGRAGLERIEAARTRPPIVVRLENDYGAPFPVWGDFVTESGVGSFSSELNLKLEGWAAHFEDHMDSVTGWDDPAAARDHAAFAAELAADMADELGPDYRVELDLWELTGVLDTEGPRR